MRLFRLLMDALRKSIGQARRRCRLRNDACGCALPWPVNVAQAYDWLSVAVSFACAMCASIASAQSTTAGAGMYRPSWVSASTPWIRLSAFGGAFLPRLRMLNPVSAWCGRGGSGWEARWKGALELRLGDIQMDCPVDDLLAWLVGQLSPICW
jgi:hypothetical protein